MPNLQSLISFEIVFVQAFEDPARSEYSDGQVSLTDAVQCLIRLVSTAAHASSAEDVQTDVHVQQSVAGISD